MIWTSGSVSILATGAGFMMRVLQLGQVARSSSAQNASMDALKWSTMSLQSNSSSQAN
jgi:hypothetical protein